MFDVALNRFRSFIRAVGLMVLVGFCSVPQLELNASDSVTVAWDPNPEPDITEYQVYYGVVGNGVTNVVSAGINTEQPVTGLAASTEYWFYVTAKNVAGLESDPSEILFHATPEPKIAPTITSPSAPSVATIGEPYTHVASANGSSPIIFIAVGLPPGITIDSNGTISGTATTAGTFNGAIIASNGTLPDATQPFSITVAPALQPISITSAPAPSAATVGNTYGHVVTATGGDTIFFDAFGLPPGVSISPNGVISGSPTTAGTFIGVITAASANSLSANQSFSIVVAAPKVAPVITSAPAPSVGTVGSAYNHTVTANGDAPITFDSFGLPPGINISPNGVISGVPTASGTFSGVITASNGTEPSASQAFSIAISPATVAPTITSVPLPGFGTVGTAYTHVVTANGDSPITFSATGLPPGVSIAPNGVVSGAPTTDGTFNGVVTAANGTSPNATQAFSVVVSQPVDPGEPPTVTLGGDRLVIVPAVLRPEAVATDDKLSPDQLTTTWTQVSGPSVSIEESNKLQPSIEVTEPGTYQFRVTVDDGGNTAFDQYQLEAYEGAEAPPPGSVVPNIQFVASTFDGLILAWDSRPNKSYQIGYKDNLNDPSWLIVGDTVPSMGFTTYWVDDRGFPTTSGFFGIFEIEK